MATLALAVAGAAVGSALLPAGVTVLGATLSGAMIGGQIGALAGSYIDQSLLGGSGQSSARGGRASMICMSRLPPKAPRFPASSVAHASAARSSGPRRSKKRS